MLYLCNAVYPQNQIMAKILSLLDNSKDIPYGKLGFTGNWRNEPIWK